MSPPVHTDFIERPSSTVYAQNTKEFDPNLLRPRVPTVDDRELIIQLRNIVGWDSDKVDRWFKMTEEGIRLQWIFELPETDSTIVGMCGIELEDIENDPDVASRAAKTVSFTSLVVRPEFRGKGYARWIAIYAEKETKRRLGDKAEWITMNTLSTNTISIQMHKSLGYEYFKEENRYQPLNSAVYMPPAFYFKKRLLSET